jgi:hypothetical protein
VVKFNHDLGRATDARASLVKVPAAMLFLAFNGCRIVEHKALAVSRSGCVLDVDVG